MDLDGLQRTFFDALYEYRIQVAIATAVDRRGRPAGRTAARLVRGRPAAPGPRRPARRRLLAVALPVGYYTASPICIRTVAGRAAPAAVVGGPADPRRDRRPAAVRPVPAAFDADPGATDGRASDAVPVRARDASRSASSHGTDDFHFGRGTASIVEIAPGRFHLRLEDFCVRNGPDLFVYLSPAADGWTADALELGRLKATDGSFGYDLPAGVDPAAFRSAIIWCKQFSHLFATAPFDVTDARTARKSGCTSVAEARTIPQANATEASVART